MLWGLAQLGQATREQPPDGEIRLQAGPVSQQPGREHPLGRMFHQLDEDSVNIQQPLACQTRFQTVACNPLAQPSREAAGAVLPPGVVGRDSLRGRGLGPLQGSSPHLGGTTASANLSSCVQRY